MGWGRGVRGQVTQSPLQNLVFILKSLENAKTVASKRAWKCDVLMSGFNQEQCMSDLLIIYVNLADH